MRSTLLLLAALLLVPHQTEAQGPQGVSEVGLGSGRIVFSPTNHTHPNEADMASLLEDRTLQTYLKPIDATTVAPQSGYALYDSNNCDRSVSCLVLLGERAPKIVIVIPFASEGGLGTTRVTTLYSADRVEASAPQLETLPRDLQNRLRIDGGAIVASDDYDLVASIEADTPDCATAACAIVTWDYNRFTLYSLGSTR